MFVPKLLRNYLFIGINKLMRDLEQIEDHEVSSGSMSLGMVMSCSDSRTSRCRSAMSLSGWPTSTCFYSTCMIVSLRPFTHSPFITNTILHHSPFVRSTTVASLRKIHFTGSVSLQIGIAPN